MKNLTGRITAGLVTVMMSMALVLSLASPVAAGAQVPFKGSLAGTVIVTPLDPPFASVVIEATGNATHLGRFALVIPHQVNQALRVGEGTYVFTAANGDTVTATFSGQGTVLAPGILSSTDVAVIIGGTGRFAGASGTFTAERIFHVATGAITGTFKGTITSPGAARR
jgi:hypothetical protein